MLNTKQEKQTTKLNSTITVLYTYKLLKNPNLLNVMIYLKRQQKKTKISKT